MTKVKICGLSTPESVLAAVRSKADYIGFVFAPSRREISFGQAAELARLIPDGIQKVGVFVSPSLETVQKAVCQVPLDLVQIHGDFAEDLFEHLPVPVIRAIHITNQRSRYSSKADFLLFDAPVAGSGKTFDWQALDKSHISQDFFIAGGLTADNVLAAIEAFSPYAVDVSSGIETDGQKDVAKITTFIERVKA